MWVNGEFSLLWSSKKKYLPFKRNNKVPKNLWLTGIFTSSLMKFKLFYIFPLLFPAPKARGKRALFTCLFSSPYLGTSGNIAGFKVIGPCLRCWQHKAKLWAPGMQAVRLGCCHGNAAGCRSSRAPGRAHPFWAIPKPPKEASQMLPCSFPAHSRNNCRPRAMNWDCSDAHIARSRTVLHRDVTLFNWRELNGELVFSWAGKWPSASLPKARKQGPWTPGNTEFLEKGDQLLPLQVGKNMKPKQKAQVLRGSETCRAAGANWKVEAENHRMVRKISQKSVLSRLGKMINFNSVKN